MVYISEKDVEEDISKQLVGESDLENMAQRVHNLFKFKNVYDQME